MNMQEEQAQAEDRGYYRVLSELSTRGFIQRITTEIPSVAFLLEGLESRWPQLSSMRAQDRYATLIADITDFAEPEELKNSPTWRFVLADRISRQHKNKADAFKAAKQLQRSISAHNAQFPPPPPATPAPSDSSSAPVERRPRNNNAKRKRTIEATLEEYKEEIREQLEELTPQLQLRLLRSLVREYNAKKKEKKE